MKMTSRFVLVSAVVGTTLVASNANAALRFFYAYGDATTVNYQKHAWGGTVANAAAAIGSEVPSSGTIAIPKAGDNVNIRLQVCVQNTGTADFYANAISVFNAFSNGATSDAQLWRTGASGTLGSAAAVSAYTNIINIGGTTPSTTSTAFNAALDSRNWEGSWVDNGNLGSYNQLRDYAIQGSNAVAPQGGRYVGYSMNGGYSTGDYNLLAAGQTYRLFDILLKSGAGNTALNVYGDDASEVGLQIIAGGSVPGNGTFFLGGKDGNFVDANVAVTGSSYKTLATPEPGTMGALALGAVAVLRRRNKKA